MPDFESRISNANRFGAWLKEGYIQSTPITIGTPDYIKYKDYAMENKDDEKEKLKKQIDKMAEVLNQMDVDEEICSKVKLDICEKYNNGNCKECIKKFFEEE